MCCDKVQYSEFVQILLTCAFKSSCQFLSEHDVGILRYIVQIGGKTIYRVKVVHIQTAKAVQF